MADSTAKEWKTVHFTLAKSNSLTDFRLDDQMTFNVNGTSEFYRGAKSFGAKDCRHTPAVLFGAVEYEVNVFNCL